jgi:hypothetical protein
MIDVLNLGAGVQSTTVALMSCVGDLPKIDCAIFADTGWEPWPVYEHLDRLKTTLENWGLPVHVVRRGNIKIDALESQLVGKRQGHEGRWGSLPYFVLNPDGSQGIVRRQCTSEYKIEVIEKFIRYDLLGLKPGQKAPANAVRQWFGISLDEYQRARSTADKWRTNYYPLIEKRITRQGCITWLHEHNFEVPPRSACIGCPYHSDAEWRDMKLNRPEEFDDACRFDETMRNPDGLRGEFFLHRSCKPLREVDLRSDFDKGQLPLFDDPAGCDSGHCFV